MGGRPVEGLVIVDHVQHGGHDRIPGDGLVPQPQDAQAGHEIEVKGGQQACHTPAVEAGQVDAAS